MNRRRTDRVHPAAPRVVRMTRLVSLPGHGAELVERCRQIADRERANHPEAYHVIQGRQPLEGNRVEVVSFTEWMDLGLMRELMPASAYERPAFFDEYSDVLESWRVEVFEVTWTTEDGSL
jgi:hypothetical protein